DVLGWLYDRLDTPWEKERRRLAWDKLNTRPFVRMLERQRPDLVLCTHFLPAEIISWLKAKARLACPQAIVVTDFDVHAMWLRHPAQIVVVCGRNEELRQRLGALAAERAGEPNALAVVGYTTEMDEYMSAADILVGKPGGLTTSEALAKQLVLVIVNPIPGQEERNSDHLLEQGAAIRCNNLPVLGYKIDRLLDDPARTAAMRENARRLARPHAAREIVEKALTLVPVAGVDR